MEIIKDNAFNILQILGGFFTLYQIYFIENLKSQIKSRVDKELKTHSLSLSHNYSRKMADYAKYVEKKHKVYSELAEKMTLVQALLSDPDNDFNPLSNVGKDRISKYIENSKIDTLDTYIEDWINSSGEEKNKKWEKVNDMFKIYRLLTLESLIPEMQQYFHLNKLYLSSKVVKKISFQIKEMEHYKQIKFIWSDEKRELESVSLNDILNQINISMEEIISMMRDDLSS